MPTDHYDRGGYVPPPPTIANHTGGPEAVGRPVNVQPYVVGLAERVLTRRPLRRRLASAWRIIRRRPR